MDEAVERAIVCIWERYSGSLSLAEIARSAFLSRFYLIRAFRAATGTSPGRFLAAVRIHQAKHLLLDTSMTTADVAFAVGYNSLGSFTSYFTDSVGVSPTLFRRMARNERFELPRPVQSPSSARGAVAGTITVPAGWAGTHVYLGAFPTAIVQRHPVAAAVVDVSGGGPAPYLIFGVPEGTWFVNAVGIADGPAPEPWAMRNVLISDRSRVTVAAGTVSHALVRLRPSRRTDPPILLALPGTEPACTPGRLQRTNPSVPVRPQTR